MTNKIRNFLVLSLFLFVIFFFICFATDYYKNYNNFPQNKRLLSKNRDLHKPYIDEINYRSLQMDDISEIFKFYKKFGKIYKGIWSSNSPILNMEKRKGVLKIELGILESSSNIRLNPHMSTNIMLYDGETFDKWTELRFRGLIETKNFDFFNNKISADELYTTMTYGEIFDKVIQSNCYSNLLSNFTNNDDRSLKSMNGRIESKICNINIEFDVSLSNDEEEEYQRIIFIIFATFLSISQILSTKWLLNIITKKKTNSKYISLITVILNIMWNLYNFVSLAYLIIILEFHSMFLVLPAFFYIFNFAYFEIRIFISIWKVHNGNSRLVSYLLRKTVMKFFLLIYFILTISLFLVLKFYIMSPYIYSIITLTWIPQIIHNIWTNNRVSLPLVNVILMSINKLGFPAYFRGYTKNFLNLNQDIPLILISITIILFEILILYLQNLLGPRFFFFKSKSTEFNFYLPIKDFLKIKDYNLMDCVICINPLITEQLITSQVSPRSLIIKDSLKNDSIASKDEVINIKKKTISSHNIDKRSYAIENNSNKCIILSKILEKISKIMFHFHDICEIKKEDFIYTPCKHIFHTECLENWIIEKRVCPTCRASFPSFLN